jgi:hypothetical protein
VQGGPAETQISAHSNLIRRSMIAPPPVLSPSSILPPPSSHCGFVPSTKNLALLKMIFIFLVLITKNFLNY